MTRSKPIIVAGVLALGASLYAQAVRLDGKWEVKVEMQMAGMNMPPQTLTQCVTPKQAIDPQHALPPTGRGGPNDCKISDYKTEGPKVSWKMTCAGATPMSGASEFVYGADSYTGTMNMNVERGGAPMAMAMKYTGKRLGDCTK
jgi:Protein of unknown function (DUF3617)